MIFRRRFLRLLRHSVYLYTLSTPVHGSKKDQEVQEGYESAIWSPHQYQMALFVALLSPLVH